MLEIEFNLHQPKTTWRAKIYQLNSDILKRHILPKLQYRSHLIDFQYCEKPAQALFCVTQVQS